ncbi:FecR domain-containing protein [Roseibium salinum]|uniref:FecR domain-containing protein n=1 Tax=Roseibium salinum TaxID=1604349 RepID=A0ABT3R2Y2_9HYPH|nr:FecR domain-containing protein [Roseibium sp. DSM 29163]MCX2723612.1 FecR domain-containing protein [Roseibium sp. DSM 29163]MDN3718524.1 FecR domain-containing protein [Roseibium salinum]
MSTYQCKWLLAIAWLLLAASAPASAQQVDGCDTAERRDPPRIIYECANGLVFEAEAAAQFDIQSSGGQPRPEAIRLEGDAVLIEVEPDSGSFQILTPHAIAAVRGTVYVVDVTADMTSVFVVRGQVEVSRLDGSDQVLLSAGDGVEVTDTTPLTVKQWPPEKVDRLLARFAR